MKNKDIAFKKSLKTGISLLFLTYICGSCLIAGDDDGKFDDVFSVGIYKQKQFRGKLAKGLSEDQVNQQLKEELIRQKEFELNKKALMRITRKIDDLKEKYELARTGEFWRKLLEQIGTTTMSATIIGGVSGGHMLGPGGELAGIAMGLLVGGSVLAVAHKIEDKINLDPNRRASVEGIIKEIRDLSFEIMDLQHEVRHESIMEIEFRYVVNKRKIKNKVLKREIEKGLIQARKKDFASDIIKQFIDLAICLPTGPKPIPHSRKKLIESFNKNKVFSSFEETLREKLLCLVTETANFSNIPDHSGLSKRKVYFFYGSPSCGKTTAAREVPIFLDLPYFELTIRSARELDADGLEGSSRLRADVNTGWIIKPLLAGDKVGLTFSNGYLIINDLDRLLMSGDAAQAQAVLAFLLDFLDPGKRRFFSPYFNTYIEVDRLNIIITSNTKLTNDFFVQAFKSRVVPIFFPDFSSAKIDSLMKEYIGHYREAVLPDQFFTITYIDSSKLGIKVNEELLRDKYEVDVTTPQIEFPIEAAKDAGGTNLRELQMRSTSSIQLFLNRTTQEGMEMLNREIESNTFYKDHVHDQLKSILLPIALKGDRKALRILEKLKGDDKAARVNVLNQLRARNGNDSNANRMQYAFDVGTYYYRHLQFDKARKWFRVSQSLGDIGIDKRLEEIEAAPRKGSLYAPDSDLWRDLLYFEVLPPHEAYNKRLGKIFLNAAKFKIGERHQELYEAYKLLAHAQSLGNQKATEKLYKLGELYEKKMGLGDACALEAYEKACEKFHAPSAFKLGWLAWINGRHDDAFKYAELSNTYGNQQYFWAKWLLGNLYESGHGVGRDIGLAFASYSQASELVSDDNLRKPFVAFKILSLVNNKQVNVSPAVLREYKKGQVMEVVKPILKDIINPRRVNFALPHLRFIVESLPHPYGFLGIELAYLMLCEEVYKSKSFVPLVRKAKKEQYITAVSTEINRIWKSKGEEVVADPQPEHLDEFELVATTAEPITGTMPLLDDETIRVIEDGTTEDEGDGDAREDDQLLNHRFVARVGPPPTTKGIIGLLESGYSRFVSGFFNQ